MAGARQRDRLGGRFWLLWCSTSAANLGDGVFQVALALLAVELTKAPLLVAGVVFAARVPWLVLALPAGALADRVDRRVTMVQMNGVRVVLLGALAIAVGLETASIWVVYLVALGLGSCEVVFDTSAHTMLPAVVDRERLARGNGRLFAAETVANQLLGPPIGGALVGVSGAVALSSSSALYFVAAVLLAVLPGRYRALREQAALPMRDEIVAGLRYLWSQRVLRTLALVLGAQNLLFTAFGALFVLFAVSDEGWGLGLGSVEVGLFYSCNAVGSAAASVAAPRLERLLGRARLLRASVVVLAACVAVPGLTRNTAAIAIAAVLMGSILCWNVVTVSLRQRIAPDDMLGRVTAGYRLLGWGGMPLGALLGGILAEVVGLRWVFVGAAAAMAALVVPLGLVVTEQAIAAAEGEADRRRRSAAGAARRTVERPSRSPTAIS